MNEINEHPGEFEFVTQRYDNKIFLPYDPVSNETRFIEKTKRQYNNSILKTSENKQEIRDKCYQTQNPLDFLLWKHSFYLAKRPRHHQRSPNDTKEKINKNNNNKRRSFSYKWKKILVIEKEYNIDQEENRKRFFNFPLSPKPFFNSQFTFSPKLKRKLKKNEPINEIINNNKMQDFILHDATYYEEYRKTELKAFRELPMIPFCPPDLLKDKSSKCPKEETKKSPCSKHNHNKSLDKVIGEAKNELFIERTNIRSDLSDYIYIDSQNVELKKEKIEENMIFDDYIDMNTIKIQHRLYSL